MSTDTSDTAGDRDRDGTSGGVATAEPAAGGRGARSGKGGGPGLLRRWVQYYREIVSELRKVIWPSRRELLTYTLVVLVFVAFMTAFVSGLDYGLTEAVLAVFG